MIIVMIAKIFHTPFCQFNWRKCFNQFVTNWNNKISQKFFQRRIKIILISLRLCYKNGYICFKQVFSFTKISDSLNFRKDTCEKLLLLLH